MTEPNVWVTGAGGLIGAYVVAELQRRFPNTKVRALTREVLDLSDLKAIDALYQRDRPSDLIHCAAISRPRECEANPKLAHTINIEATRRLLERFEDRPFVFLSTDVVFDGSSGAYQEEDPVNPLGLYAETKVQGELMVQTNPKSLIIRTSLNGGVSRTRDRGFNEPLYRAWANGETTGLFDDEYRNPIAAAVTARAIVELWAQQASGLFHVTGAQKLSRWRIGELLAARRPDLNPSIRRERLRDYQGPPRAPDCSLNCRKAQERLPFPLPNFEDWLALTPNEAF